MKVRPGKYMIALLAVTLLAMDIVSAGRDLSLGIRPRQIDTLDTFLTDSSLKDKASSARLDSIALLALFLLVWFDFSPGCICVCVYSII